MTTPDILLKWLAPQPGEHVLDVGCGLGQHSAMIAALGARVTGIDPEAHLLENARVICPGGEFVAVGLLDYAPSVSFDAIFANAVLHWIQPTDLVLSRLFQLLRPGGRMAGTYGARAREAANLVNYNLPEASHCRQLLQQAGFSDVHMEQANSALLFRAARPLAGTCIQS